MYWSFVKPYECRTANAKSSYYRYSYILHCIMGSMVGITSKSRRNISLDIFLDFIWKWTVQVSATWQSTNLLAVGNETVCSGNEVLNPVSVLTVCQVVEKVTHLAGQTWHIVTFTFTLIHGSSAAIECMTNCTPWSCSCVASCMYACI